MYARISVGRDRVVIARGQVFKDREVGESVVESAREPADYDEGIGTAFDRDLDRRLRVGDVLFGLEANYLRVLGNFALGKGMVLS